MATSRRVIAPIAVVATLVLSGCDGSTTAKATDAKSTSVAIGPTAGPSSSSGPPASVTDTAITTTGPSPSPTPVQVDAAAQRVFSRSKAATARLVSLRIVDTVVTSGATQKLDVRFAQHGTAARITRAGYTFDIMFIGQSFYFHAPLSFIRARYKTTIPPAVKKSEGRFVVSSATGGTAKPYASLANRTAVLGGVYYAHPNLIRGANKRIGGITCIGLVDPGKGTFYVRADNDLPVEIVSTGTDGSKLTFSDFNRVPDPQAPPKGQAVDSKGNPV